MSRPLPYTPVIITNHGTTAFLVSIINTAKMRTFEFGEERKLIQYLNDENINWLNIYFNCHLITAGIASELIEMIDSHCRKVIEAATLSAFSKDYSDLL